MKIEIDIDEKYTDLGVKVTAPDLTPDIERIISLMRMMDMQIPVKRDDETILLDVDEILYIEAVERNTFVYTKDSIPVQVSLRYFREIRLLRVVFPQ